METFDYLLKYLSLKKYNKKDALEALQEYNKLNLEEGAHRVIVEKQEATALKQNKKFDDYVKSKAGIIPEVMRIPKYHPALRGPWSVFNLFSGKNLLVILDYPLHCDDEYLQALRSNKFIQGGYFSQQLKDEWVQTMLRRPDMDYSKYYRILNPLPMSMDDLHREQYVCTYTEAEQHWHGRLRKSRAGEYFIKGNHHDDQPVVDVDKLSVHPIVNFSMLKELAHQGVTYDKVYLVEPKQKDWNLFQRELPYMQACCSVAEDGTGKIILLSTLWSPVNKKESGLRKWKSTAYIPHRVAKRPYDSS